MLPEELRSSLREQLSRAGMVVEGPRAEGRSGVALPDALKYRAPLSPAVTLVLRSTRISTDPDGCRARRHHDQTFSASNVP